MSCYEWAEGTIKIPTREWSSFRKQIISIQNSYLDSAYMHARDIYAEAKAAFKGKRDKRPMITFVFERIYSLKYPEHIRDLISSSLIEFQPDWSRKLVLPKKKDFQKANLKTTDYGNFVFDHDEKTVTFIVEENNRAVDLAFKNPFNKAIFTLLDNINWTRGSGGKIIGNDEYNTDDCSEGGGANYVVREWNSSSKNHSAFISYRNF
jgi:hypothetical protein